MIPTVQRRGARVALAVGLLAFVGGWQLHHAVAASAAACQLTSILRAVVDIAGSTSAPAPPSCTGIALEAWGGVGLMAVGAVTFLAAWIIGMPVWVRPLSARLRMRPHLLAQLSLVLLVAAAIGARFAWRIHERSVEHRQRAVAERALATLVLPAGISPATREDMACGTRPEDRCAISSFDPVRVAALLVNVVHGHRDDRLCATLLPSDGTCPVSIYGTLADYPVVAIAFRRIIRVQPGHTPPPGSRPFRPGSKQDYFFGSEITISLLTPED